MVVRVVLRGHTQCDYFIQLNGYISALTRIEVQTAKSKLEVYEESTAVQKILQELLVSLETVCSLLYCQCLGSHDIKRRPLFFSLASLQ